MPDALAETGLTPLRVDELADGQPVEAVVQGAGLDVTWRDIAEVSYLAQAGALWVATNLDATIPTARGLSPGNGAFVEAVRATTPVSPYVTGKPGTALFDLACSRLGCDPSDTIMVGDRLDTDIVGARSAGVDSLFVLGGASSLRDLAFAEDEARPTYFAFDLSGLLRARPLSERTRRRRRDLAGGCALGTTSCRPPAPPAGDRVGRLAGPRPRPTALDDPRVDRTWNAA